MQLLWGGVGQVDESGAVAENILFDLVNGIKGKLCNWNFNF